ncbi:signal peptidase I [Microbacterium binotii]|uniref:Signal peptidase I n=1 Tax=Microbacterium binotii TaxID=462710 RepID=A0ABN3P943_9MICO
MRSLVAAHVAARIGATTALAVGMVLVIVAQLFQLNFLAVTSDSMAPTWHKGDILVVAPPMGGELVVGQPVVFASSEDGTTTHRIYKVDEATGTAWTKGDANDAPDSATITADDLRGRPDAVLTGWRAEAIRLYSNPALMVALSLAAFVAWLIPLAPKRKRTPKTSAADGQPPTSEPLEAS